MESQDATVEHADLEECPLATRISKNKTHGADGGNAKSECLHCGSIIPGSYSRVKAHLFKEQGKGISICTQATPEMVAQFHAEEDAAKSVAQDSSPRSVPMPVHIPVTYSVGRPPSGKRKKQSGITESFHNEFRQMADSLIARMFYTGGIPFNLARNPNYRASYNFIANHDMGGYVPPGVNKLRTTLLQQEKQNVEKLLEPLKKIWGAKGVTIASDG
ncbi:hypothetical protein PR202_gb19078 [Eleusine coracana subsp. coracana]|uniref:DUF659 domain-containing protein n=1 Tax=Eleusine coracana subsp. coracana TaxID=191504 RepID=A0AAV5F525_ELECO|nr:hypothetical protein PR202_gb19078 [Eleusine coracana subsp. coracana]